MSSTNKLTLAGVGVFLLFILSAGLGFCGNPTDQQPKPSSSSSK